MCTDLQMSSSGRSRAMRYGQRSFAVSGPTLRNSLPLTVRDPSLSLSPFCVCFQEDHLFLQSLSNINRDSLGSKACCVNINILTYFTSVSRVKNICECCLLIG